MKEMKNIEYEVNISMLQDVASGIQSSRIAGIAKSYYLDLINEVGKSLSIQQKRLEKIDAIDLDEALADIKLIEDEILAHNLSGLTKLIDVIRDLRG